MERRPFKVSLTKTVVKEFTVDAITPEQAESIATQWDKEGEEGVITVSEVEFTDVVPVEEIDGDTFEVDPTEEIIPEVA